jgi:hypothetical protein
MDTYKATNTTNGKFYIGSTTNFEERKKAHLRSKDKYPFQNALRKNPEVFEWEVWSDEYDEPILEQALLDMWYGKECCYNLNPIANRPPRDPEGIRKGGAAAGKIAKERGQIQQLGKLSGQGRKNVESGLLQSIARLGGLSTPREQLSAMGKAGGAVVGKMPYWTNGEKNRRSYECPGEGWRRGMTKKGKQGKTS